MQISHTFYRHLWLPGLKVSLIKVCSQTSTRWHMAHCTFNLRIVMMGDTGRLIDTKAAVT